MKKLISLFVIVALMMAMLCTTVSAEEHDAVDYIEDNVSSLANVYAQLHPDSNEIFTGQYIEFMIPVTIVSTDSVGTYIDFDDDNGYMVLQGRNDVIKWEVCGDLKYLKELENTYYSILDGFGYLEDEIFVAYEERMDNTNSITTSSPYQGQAAAGDGAITDFNAYMNDRYSGYQFYNSDYLNTSFDYVRQYYLSFYYYITESGAYESEGNCALSSIYALLNYLGASRRCDFPDKNTKGTYYPSNDSFYYLFEDDPQYYIPVSVTVPKLYYTVRQYAVERYGYRDWGLGTLETDNVIELAAAHYQNDIDASVHTLGSFDSFVVPELAEDDPVLIAVSNSSTYGGHSMVVTGYRIYKKTTTILGINFTDYVYLLRVNDNWSAEARYFDLTAFSGTWAYITIEVND